MSNIIHQSPSSEDVHAALLSGPGADTAFLGVSSSPRKIAETMVALANAQGGLIIAGVTTAAKVAGLSHPEKTRDLMASAALIPEPPLILPSPKLLEVKGKQICVSQIPPGLAHVYSVKGQYLIRDGRSNRPLLPNELRHLLLNRNDAGFESQIIEGAKFEDLDQERIQAYHTLLDGAGLESNEALLLSRGCLKRTTEGIGPTIAGVLLFGKEPQRWMRASDITCVRYPGESMGDDFVREDIQGVLADQIRRGEAFVSANMRQGMRLRGLEREDIPEYPISVVRETIVNAVAHRDYSIRGDNIRVLMFSDRLEVYSPGRLPGHITIANLVDERYSRNETIVQVLSEMGFIERLGYGIDRIFAVCEDEGLPQPRFVETAAGFQVTIYGHGPNLIGAPPPTSMFSHLQLNPRQELALIFMHENKRITNRDYQQLCPDASPETLRRDFSDLVNRGILLKIGERRATYYVLK